MSKILGGTKSVSNSVQNSSNQGFGAISGAFNPLLSLVGEGVSGLRALLGGDTTGFDKFKTGTGFNFELDRGMDGISSGGAAKRMFNSGATAKGLQAFGTGLQSTYADKYLQQLLGMSNVGLGAANAITGAGNISNMTSNSTSKSSPGLASLIGPAASLAAASDRRLKKNIHVVGKLPNGVTLYQYRYLNDAGPYVGVMADEVATTVPEALGPEVSGYMTVDYSKLGV